jgi:P27 family predicted phage terminase small subunit
MKLIADLPQPPPHLSESARQWWQSCVDQYVLQDHHLRLLQLACEAWDRCQSAREQLDREGLILEGRQGAKPHPAAAIARDAALVFSRLLRELDLDVAPPPDVVNNTRPPPILSNRGRHARKTTAS